MKCKKFFEPILLFALVSMVMLFFSFESPLCVTSFYPDVNSHMVIGRALNSGLKLYEDVYDTKGPSLFLLSRLVNMISDDTFIGFWFVEIISVFSYIWFSLKTLRIMNPEKKVSIVYSLLGLLVWCGCLYQAHTFTIEMLLLGMLSYVLYLYACALKVGEISSISFLMTGILAGFIFWSKYNLMVYFAIFYIALVFCWKSNKTLFYILKKTLWIVVGFLLITAMVFLENDFSVVFNYYLLGAFKYAANNPNSTSVNILYVPMMSCISFFGLVLSLFSVVYEKDNSMKTLFFIYYGVHTLLMVFLYNGIIYYMLPYMLTTVIGIYYFAENVFSKKDWKVYVLTGAMAIYCFAGMLIDCNIERVTMNTDECVQYQMADIINSSTDVDKTMMCDFDRGAMSDVVVMNLTKVIPNMQYFMTYNHVAIRDAHDKAISDKSVSFILTDREQDYNGYHLVGQGPITDYENCFTADTLYLYKVNN